MATTGTFLTPRKTTKADVCCPASTDKKTEFLPTNGIRSGKDRSSTDVHEATIVHFGPATVTGYSPLCAEYHVRFVLNRAHQPPSGKRQGDVRHAHRHVDLSGLNRVSGRH